MQLRISRNGRVGPEIRINQFSVDLPEVLVMRARLPVLALSLIERNGNIIAINIRSDL